MTALIWTLGTLATLAVIYYGMDGEERDLNDGHW